MVDVCIIDTYCHVFQKNNFRWGMNFQKLKNRICAN